MNTTHQNPGLRLRASHQERVAYACANQAFAAPTRRARAWRWLVANWRRMTSALAELWR